MSHAEVTLARLRILLCSLLVFLNTVSPLRLSFGNCPKLNIIINLNVIIIANPELLIHAVLVFLYHLKYPFVLHLILYIANLQKNIISECDIMKSYDCLDTIITNGGNHLNCGPS